MRISSKSPPLQPHHGQKLEQNQKAYTGEARTTIQSQLKNTDMSYNRYDTQFILVGHYRNHWLKFTLSSQSKAN